MRTRMMGMGLLLALLLLGGCQAEQVRERNKALKQENRQLRKELEDTRQALDQVESERQTLRARLEKAREKLQKAREKLQSRQQRARRPAPAPKKTGFEEIEEVETERRAGQVAVQVPGDILFASGSAELKSSAKDTLKEIAGVLKQRYGEEKIRVEGYTDSVPIKKSDWTDNLELSLHRAAAVHRYLQKQDIPMERMYAAGFGPTDLRDTKKKSRRVEIVVVRESRRDAN